MSEITSRDGELFSIDGEFEVGVFPYPLMPSFPVVKLDLVRRDTIAILVDGTESVADTDAAVTQNKNLALAIRTRDCAPICISDGTRFGIAHVGWPGYALGLTEKFLSYFDLEKAHVYVGPFLNQFEIRKDDCYEKLMAHPGTEPHIKEEDGLIMFYFKEALAALLPESTVWDTRTTHDDPTLPSYRRSLLN
jgi:copper oxidase (laccase) domain-containing protein